MAKGSTEMATWASYTNPNEAMTAVRTKVQHWRTAIQVEECQAFIQRSQNRLSRMEQDRIAEQKELDAAIVLTRLREEI